MAMTVACARCHDHKFDPIPTADYYSLHGVFASTIEPADKPLIGAEPDRRRSTRTSSSELAELEAEEPRAVLRPASRTKSAEFRKKAGDYLLVAAIGRSSSRRRAHQAAQQAHRRGQARPRHLPGRRSATRRGTDDPVVRRRSPLFAQLPDGRVRRAAPRDVLRASSQNGAAQAAAGARQPARRRRRSRRSPPGSLQVAARRRRRLRQAVRRASTPQAKAYIEACRNGEDADEVDGLRRRRSSQLISIAGRRSSRPAALDARAPARARAASCRVQSTRAATSSSSSPDQRAAADPPRLARRGRWSSPTRTSPQDSPIFIRGEQQQPRRRSSRGGSSKSSPAQGPQALHQRQRPARAGRGDREQGQPADRPRDGQPDLDAPLRRGLRPHAGRPRRAVRAAEPSGAARLPRVRASSTSGWSIKKMHRLIMLSSTYQQSSDTNPAYAAEGPGQPPALAGQPPPARLRGRPRLDAACSPASSTARSAASR